MAGWNGSGMGGNSTPVKPKVTAKKPSPIRGLVAGLMIVLAAGAYFIFFSGSEKTQKVESQKKPTKIEDAKPVQKSVKPSVEKPKSEKPKEEDIWLGKKVNRRTAVTNGTMIVEYIYTEDGKKHKYYHDTTKPIFEHASDQMLAMATADNGRSAPPLPSLGRNFENQFADSLKTEIVIKDDDPEAVKEAKARVKQARQELLDAMGAGMSAQDVIMEHRKMMENNAAMRMDVVKGLKEYIEKGDTEGAQEYVEKMNQALEQMGIMKIEMPKTREESIAERKAKSEARRTQQQEENK